MGTYYDFKLIRKILENFKIKKIVVSGLKNKKLLDEILRYTDNIITINLNELDNIKSIMGNPLNGLLSLNDYDAIFIDDDANWYTLYNELNIIKKTNKKFPLVFICNNKFPNKRRDCYINPNIIPKKFRQEYTNNLIISEDNEKIKINDGFYHAIVENTPKNGVLRAIEDFLSQNNHIDFTSIDFLDEMIVLYPKLIINKKRIENILDNVNNDNLSNKLLENKLLTSDLNTDIHNDDVNDLKLEISKKNSEINKYINQIKNYENKLDYQNSHIDIIERKLTIAETKIENMESELINKEKELINKNSTLENKIKQLNITQIRLNNLENSFLDEKNNLKNFKNQLKDMNIQLKNQYNELNNKNNSIIQKDDKIKNLKQELNNKKNQLNSLGHNYTKQLSKMEEKEYSISSFKNEISNNNAEIRYLKTNNFIKKILSPIGYLYLILKSHPNEISLNLNLYRTIKYSDCFDIGFYLNNNVDLIDSKWYKYFSLELHYVCKGFSEKRAFNKKYFNKTSKKKLLDCFFNCGEGLER